MLHLPYELQCTIYHFLPLCDLNPLNRASLPHFRSNVVWQPRVEGRFGKMVSHNYFREFMWQLQLERHQMCYQRQWTLGCVGRLTPLQKPSFVAAAI